MHNQEVSKGRHLYLPKCLSICEANRRKNAKVKVANFEKIEKNGSSPRHPGPRQEMKFFWTNMSHFQTCFEASLKKGSKRSRLNAIFLLTFYAKMKTVFILITLGNLVFYEITEEDSDFCPYSRCWRWINPRSVFCDVRCHTGYKALAMPIFTFFDYDYDW
jgi:hypothetical protein